MESKLLDNQERELKFNFICPKCGNREFFGANRQKLIDFLKSKNLWSSNLTLYIDKDVFRLIEIPCHKCRENGKIIIMVFFSDSYCCPICGWDDYINDSNYEYTGYYYIRKGIRKKKYPIYSDSKYFDSGPYGYSYIWKERHFCPHCKMEFVTDNSSP